MARMNEDEVTRFLSNSYSLDQLSKLIPEDVRESPFLAYYLQQLLEDKYEDVNSEFKKIDIKALPISVNRFATVTSSLMNNGINAYEAYSAYLAANDACTKKVFDSETETIVRLASKALILQLIRQKDLCEKSKIPYKNLFNVDYDEKRGIVTRDIEKIYRYIIEQIRDNNKFYLPTENQRNCSGIILPKTKIAFYTLSHFSTLDALKDEDYDTALKFLLIDSGQLEKKSK